MSAKKYKCSVCGYVFNAANAAKYYSLDGSLQFEDVPIDWKCPICGYSKEFFVEIEYSELQTKEKSKKCSRKHK